MPTNPQAWSLDQALAAQYAAQAGLDSEVGAAAGRDGWDVLKTLRDAVREPNHKRRENLALLVKKRLQRINFQKHAELVKQAVARLRVLEHQEARINPKTGLQEFAFEPTNPSPPSGPTSARHWLTFWGDNPNDKTIASKARSAAVEADSRGDVGTMKALRDALEQRALPLATPMAEAPLADLPDYERRLNEYGLWWGVHPNDFGSLEPAGAYDQKYWDYSKNKSRAANALKERGLAVDINGRVGIAPNRFHPNPIAEVLSTLNSGIARRSGFDNMPSIPDLNFGQ